MLDGVWKQFFMDGSLKAEANYKDGLREGKKTYYYSNGKIYCTGFYRNDFKKGAWEYFNEQGLSDTIINHND